MHAQHARSQKSGLPRVKSCSPAWFESAVWFVAGIEAAPVGRGAGADDGTVGPMLGGRVAPSTLYKAVSMLNNRGDNLQLLSSVSCANEASPHVPLSR